jgi:hypothetical protein
VFRRFRFDVFGDFRLAQVLGKRFRRLRSPAVFVVFPYLHGIEKARLEMAQMEMNL